MLVLLVLAGVASAVLLGLAVAAFVQRRSRPYLLVALALGALVARTIVGGSGAIAVVSPEVHHTLEHALDVVMAALVIGAVVFARRIRPTVGDRS